MEMLVIRMQLASYSIFPTGLHDNACFSASGEAPEERKLKEEGKRPTPPPRDSDDEGRRRRPPPSRDERRRWF